MDEQSVLERLTEYLPAAGDDAAVVDDLLVTTDMLHATTDFPRGTTRFTAGWRAVAASLSDVAAMGGEPIGTVAIYGAPSFDWDEISAFVDGARAVSEGVGAEYLGGDLDSHQEFTVATTAIGRVDDPVYRSGAQVGDAVCVTGTLGRSAIALRLFAEEAIEDANELFRFTPRVDAGSVLGRHATAMIDSSDGLARSLHQLAAASNCGFAIESPLPVDNRVDELATIDERREMALYFGEDFELVCTLPPERVDDLRPELSVQLRTIGRVTEEGVTLDGERLPDRGYTHGGD